MKINRLIINELRGVREFEINPNSKHVLIQGENGTGKSGVIDAIDFLFTGSISRISGSGFQGVTLAKHGKHISCADKKECWVEASIQLDDGSISKIKRCLSRPDQLVIENESSKLLNALQVARRGKFFLSRREILNFIASTASHRGQQIQELLRLEDIESARKYIGKLKRDARKQVSITDNLFEQTIAAYRQMFLNNGIPLADSLNKVNEYRRYLGGEDISKLDSEVILEGINKPHFDAKKGVANKEQMLSACGAIRSSLSSEFVADLVAKEDKLIAFVREIVSDPLKNKAYKEMKLVENGLKLVEEETSSCPLCDADWSHRSLFSYLNSKLEMAQHIQSIEREIRKLSVDMKQTLIQTRANFEIIRTEYEKMATPYVSAPLIELVKQFDVLIEEIGNPFGEGHESRLPKINTELFFNTYNPVDLVGSEEKFINANVPDLNKSISCWTFLNTLQSSIERKRLDRTEKEKAHKRYEKLNVLEESFLTARDTVLIDLYNSISERFEFLYKIIHAEDEGEFKAKITPKPAGLDLGVDFHGMGIHPPQAMHSDGHQDSMGLCLYLALAEKLHEGTVKFVALDDVVISIDAGHRRKIAELLADQFPEVQFFITTHEVAWSNQLKMSFGKSLGEFIRFRDWTVETGPMLSRQVDFIEETKRKVAGDDINGAAHSLRRGLEEFFANVCESFQAKVAYRSNASWTLNETLDASIGKLGNIYKESIKASKSWGNDTSELESLKVSFSKADAKRRDETWAMNPMVHFNSWLQMTAKDFLPIVEAYEEFCSFFKCRHCGAILRYSPDSIRCGCPQTYWTLGKKRQKK